MRNRAMVLSNNSTDFQFLRDKKRKQNSRFFIFDHGCYI